MSILNDFVVRLLHLEDKRNNRLVDLGDLTNDTTSSSGDNVYLLDVENKTVGEFALDTIRVRRGKPSNQNILENSSIDERGFAGLAVKWKWRTRSGQTDVKQLHKFIDDAYRDMNLMGNNPMFFGVGTLTWNAVLGEKVELVTSPLLIFPVRLVRGNNLSSVEIDFVDDDAFFNPCLINLLEKTYPNRGFGFPHPNGEGADFDEAIDLDKLLDGKEYFDRVELFLSTVLKPNDGLEFKFNRNNVVISIYDHSDICMYYDVRRNMDKIRSHPLVNDIFGEGESQRDIASTSALSANDLPFVLPKDSIQQELITKVANGQSVVIKGPPGTGKTLTIANMIAVLMSQGKRVMLASKKIAALTEVYNKLPEPLRKFVMLLAYETEEKASKVNTSTVKEEFRNVLHMRRSFKPAPTILAKRNSALRRRQNALSSIATYERIMFGAPVIAGRNYYTALDDCFAVDLPVAPLGEECMTISAAQLANVKEIASDMGRHYADFKTGKMLSDSPWYNLGKDVVVDDFLFPVYGQICDAANRVFKELEQIQQVRGVALDKFPVGMLAALSGQNVWDFSAVEKLMRLADGNNRQDKFAFVLNCYNEKLPYANVGVQINFDGTELPTLVELGVDSQLTIAQIRKLDDNRELLLKKDRLILTQVELESLRKAIAEVESCRNKARAFELEAIKTFNNIRGRKFGANVCTVHEKLQACRTAEGYDLKKASRIVGRFAKFTLDKLPSTDKLIAAVENYHNYFVADNDAQTQQRFVSTLLKLAHNRLLSEEQYQLVALVVNRCAITQQGEAEYLNKVHAARTLIDHAKSFGVNRDSISVGDIVSAYELRMVTQQLNHDTQQCCEDAGLTMPSGDIGLVATAVNAAMFLSKYAKLVCAIDAIKIQLIKSLGDISSKCVGDLNFVADKLSEVRERGFVNRYTYSPRELTLEDLHVFCADAQNRRAAGAAVRYADCKSKLAKFLNISALFDGLEMGELEVLPNDFGDYVEHSVLHAAICEFIKKMGNAHNDFGHNVVKELAKLDEAESDIQQLNVQSIEEYCLGNLNPDDVDYGFLANDAGTNLNMRGMFKRFARAIFKLKRCFILSPSTASVLFRPEEYSQFDAVIVDEASQLEPVYLLPLLFRSKQCVLVGDEYQMPPIKHFTPTGDVPSDLQGNDLQTNISALSLALVRNVFEYRELQCHYRSRTESLIAFSQERFYPRMRTFPAALPFADGLGFKDIFVPDGFCDGGQNAPEADRVLELLHEHFDKYFDLQAGKLAEGHSIGVVAFGAAQLKLIGEKLQRDKDLNDMISRACGAVDVPEKAVFLRTVETVQGQETDHLILSFTYGRNDKGNVVRSIGELNQIELGRKIFNVAVTRARNSVTLVHSVQPYELDGNEKIRYIVDYMRLAERFSQGGARQFVANDVGVGRGFVADVVRFVKSLGVPPERIVVGYGVTQGSVRIPIAILSEDMSEAVMGIWCELPVDASCSFVDYNLLYFNSLCERKWKLWRISAHEWFDSNQNEKENLSKQIKSLMNI